MEIIKADINDARLVGYVHSTAWKQAYVDIFPAEYLSTDTLDKRAHEFQESCINDGINYYLVYEKEKAVGIVKLMYINSENYEIASFYILAEYRNKGYGGQVMEYLKDMFDKANLYLWVLEENRKARHFYENNGFKNTGKTRRICRGNYYTQLQYEFVSEV